MKLKIIDLKKSIIEYSLYGDAIPDTDTPHIITPKKKYVPYDNDISFSPYLNSYEKAKATKRRYYWKNRDEILRKRREKKNIKGDEL